MRLAIPALALLLVAAGCASAPQAGGARRSSTEISEEEVRASNQQNAYDMVMMLRPGWLREGGPTTLTQGDRSGAAAAYVDGQRLGSIEELRGIAAAEVASVRRYNAVTAQQRFGLGNVNGAVEVITRRGTPR